MADAGDEMRPRGEGETIPPQTDTIHRVLERYLNLENDTWEAMRRVALGAAGGGLAISFLLIDIDGTRVNVFPFVWAFLLVTMLLGFASYGLRATAARRLVESTKLTMTLVPPAPPRPTEIVFERRFIALAGGTVFTAFVLIVYAATPLV